MIYFSFRLGTTERRGRRRKKQKREQFLNEQKERDSNISRGCSPTVERTRSERKRTRKTERIRFLFSVTLFSFPNCVYLSPDVLPTNTSKYLQYRVVQSNLLWPVCVCTVFRALDLLYGFLNFIFLKNYSHRFYPAAEPWRTLPTIIMTEVKNLRCFLLAHTTVQPMACVCVCEVAKAFCEQ